MKKIFNLILLFPLVIIGQSNSENWVKTTSYKIGTQNSLNDPTIDQANQSVTYIDGLGKPIQKIDKQMSSLGKNIVSHIEYDVFGRKTKDYLPYVSTNGGLEYEPNANTDLSNYYQTGLTSADSNFETTSFPYSEKQIEDTPLDRVFKQASPGFDWSMNNGHVIGFDYQTNADHEVRYFKANASWNSNQKLYDITLIDNGHFAENELYKTITKDENWTGNDDHTTQEFKDKEGRIVLKRTFENNVPHDTYYVYDQFGNLTYVLPPLVDTSNGVSSIDLEGLCYQYKYDYRNRLVEKKLPGRQKEYIVYDNLDRVVATGPVQSPFNDISLLGFMITKYDDFNRVVYTGWTALMDYSGDTSVNYYRQAVNQSVKISEVRSQTQTLDGIAINYSKLVFPYNDIYLLTVNYYDDYNFPDHNEISGAVFGNPVLVNTKGLATGSWVRVPTSVSSMLSEKVTTTYDNKLRAIAVNKTNSMGGYTNSKTQYSFIGQVLHTETEHKKNSSFVAITIKEDFTYSPQGRLIDHFHQIDDNDIERIATNRYSNLGQLIHKFVGGANDVGLQKVDYSYNIRGWLKEINKLSDLTETNVPTDLFAFKINYNTVDNDLGGTVLPLYNGNISETFWKTSSDNVTRKYGYQYDALNRLNKATYQKPNFPVQVTNSYNEEISYDANGNILNLRRNGELDDQGMALPIDDLEYRYDQNNPNRLIKVNDLLNNPSGFSNDDVTDPNDMNDDYKYDDYGNMIRDDNKNIKSIVYNHLNLPVLIDFGALGRISYIYNAVGQKISKRVVDANLNTTVETFYIDGFQYKGDNLQFFPHAEGYVNCNAPKLLLVPTTDGGLQEVYLDDGTPTFSYVYNYTDHLGNIRLCYTKNPQSGALSIIEENHYYPFGLKHNNYNSDKNMYAKEQEQLKIKPVPPLFKPAYNYKYNGKELQDELGLNMYDYGMRNYDPALGRWMNIDPKAELLEISSPYVYALNCPIIYLDRDGELPILINGHVSDDSERASASYWGTEIINTIKGSGIANPGGQFHYVDGDRGVMSDGRTEERYPQYRVAGGRMQADADWNTILSKLEKDPKTGKIIEKIQIYTHSRGAAFGQGYTERLLQLIKENSDMFENASSEVDFVFDMAPHQSGYLNAVKGTSTYTMDHEGDPLSDNDKSGVNAAFTSGETTKGAFGSHKIGSFAKDIKEFAKAFTQGKSTQSVIDTFVKNMKDKYGIKVEVEQ